MDSNGVEFVGTSPRAGYYLYGTLDSLTTRGSPQGASRTWAFNFEDELPFWITYQVWAERWPAAATVVTPLAGGNAQNPEILVAQSQPGVSLRSILFYDEALTEPVPGTDHLVDPAAFDGTTWDVFPNGNSDTEVPLAELTDGTVYHVGFFSEGQDEGTPSATIRGSRFASDSFRFAADAVPYFPVGSGTTGTLYKTLHGGSNERIRWISSAASTYSRFTVYACSGSGCSGRGAPIAGYDDVLVSNVDNPSGSGNMQTDPVKANLVNGVFYKWQATQYFGGDGITGTGGAAGGSNQEQIFRYSSAVHSGATDPPWPP